MNKEKDQNKIGLYRSRIQFTPEEVSNLLGHGQAGMLAKYEDGLALPPLKAALRLAIILRVPVEFLFPELYERLRNEVRAEEERQRQLRWSKTRNEGAQ